MDGRTSKWDILQYDFTFVYVEFKGYLHGFKVRNLLDTMSLEFQEEYWAGDSDLGIMRQKCSISHGIWMKSLGERVQKFS